MCHTLLQPCPQTRVIVFPKSQVNPLLMPWCFCLFAWKPSIKPGWKPKTRPAESLTTHPSVWLYSGCTPVTHMVPGQLPEGGSSFMTMCSATSPIRSHYIPVIRPSMSNIIISRLQNCPQLRTTGFQVQFHDNASDRSIFQSQQ